MIKCITNKNLVRIVYQPMHVVKFNLKVICHKKTFDLAIIYLEEI